MVEKTAKYYKFILIIIAFTGLLVVLFFGNRKQGYYLDEMYTVTPANGTLFGVAADEGKWNATSDMFRQMSVQSSERFSYKRIYDNTYGVIHPPLYYMLYHTVCSFFVDKYSKWFGIGLNAFIYFISVFVIFSIAKCIAGDDYIAALTAALVYALSPAIISGVMLNRAYFTMSLFAEIYCLLIMKDFSRNTDCSLTFPAKAFIVGLIGLFFDYMFLPIMLLLMFSYCVYLFFLKKKYKYTFVYCIVQAFMLIFAYVIYHPIVKAFTKSKRAGDVSTNLKSISLSGMLDRIKLFGGNLNRGVFGNLIIIAVLFTAVGIFVAVKNRKHYLDMLKDFREGCVGIFGFCMLFFTCTVYFLFMTKVGLKSGRASNRFVLPIYGFIIVFSVLLFFSVLKRYTRYSILMTWIIAFAMLFGAYKFNGVDFLYESRAIVKDFEREHSSAELIVVKDDGEYDAWIEEYLAFDRVFFANAEDLSTLDNPDLESLDEIIVYVDKKHDPERKSIDKILSLDKKIDSYEIVYEGQSNFVVYYLH